MGLFSTLATVGGGIGGFLLGGPAGALTGAGLAGGLFGGGGDFFTGTEGELTEEQRRALEAIQALQGDISGRIGEIQDRPVLDAATINAIRSITGGVAASTGSALGARLAGQGTLGGGIGNQALAQIEGQRQTSLSNALAQAALQGRGQNLAFESSLFGQQAGLLGQQATLAGQFRPDTPGLLQGLLPGIGQAVGAGLFGKLFPQNTEIGAGSPFRPTGLA